MIIAYLESIKYLGLMWPVALLRIFMGYYFLEEAIGRINSGFLTNPVLQEVLRKWCDGSHGVPAYEGFIENFVLPHWQVFSHLAVFGGMAVGLSYIFGLMVRPASLVAILLSVNFLMATGPDTLILNKILIAINVMFLLSSPGRCLGFDYYFYKRVRGIWW